jgi:hypothetical protein
VRIDGKDHYLGKYGTDESRSRYDRLVAAWLANSRALPPSESLAVLGLDLGCH